MPEPVRAITPDSIRTLVTDQSRDAARAAQARDRREAERLAGIQITDDGAVIASSNVLPFPAESRIERIVYSAITAVADMETAPHSAESRAELDLLIASCAQLSEVLWQCERTARTYREHFREMRAK